MDKRFSPEFKQQAIDNALSNSHQSVAAIAQKLDVGYSTLDKWIREANPRVQVNSNSRQNNSVFSIQKKKSNNSGKSMILKKGACVLPNRSCQEKYKVIQGLAMTEITVSSACKCLGVTASGYYAWRKKQIYVNQKYTDLKVV